MASYDSDSSDDEQSYTDTSVLLGYASKDATDDAISHLGGRPQWLDEKTPAPGNLAKCKVCNGLLNLLLELNGDLPERFPYHERRLYLLGCRRKACRRKDGSFRGFRGTRVSRAPETSQSKGKAADRPQPIAPPARQDLGTSIFGGKPATTGMSASNPFAAPTSSSPQVNPFGATASLAAKPPQRPQEEDITRDLPETFASKARIAAAADPPASKSPLGPPEPWPADSAFPTPYPHHHLDADYESLSPSSIPAIPQRTQVDMDIDGDDTSATTNGASSKDKEADREAFESAMDRTFQRFADRVAQNPEQVLRYEIGGQPLLYSKDDSVGRIIAPAVGELSSSTAATSRVPRCENCGAARTYELQLMPAAIEALEEGEEGLDGMDWGTIILMVCEKDCGARGVAEGQVGYVEEWVGVQWEEVVVVKR